LAAVLLGEVDGPALADDAVTVEATADLFVLVAGVDALERTTARNGPADAAVDRLGA
jgi:hypothetical protein